MGLPKSGLSNIPRTNTYKNGCLDVPEKYTYLRDNMSKRDPLGLRKRASTSTRGATIRKEGRTTGGKKTKESFRTMTMTTKKMKRVETLKTTKRIIRRRAHAEGQLLK
jgi:hypothetical protein